MIKHNYQLKSGSEYGTHDRAGLLTDYSHRILEVFPVLKDQKNKFERDIDSSTFEDVTCSMFVFFKDPESEYFHILKSQQPFNEDTQYTYDEIKHFVNQVKMTIDTARYSSIGMTLTHLAEICHYAQDHVTVETEPQERRKMLEVTSYTIACFLSRRFDESVEWDIVHDLLCDKKLSVADWEVEIKKVMDMF